MGSHKRLGLLLTAVLLAVSACSAQPVQDADQENAAYIKSGSQDQQLDQDQRLAQAQRLGASYDYQAALDLLQGVPGSQAQQLRSELEQAKQEALVWQHPEKIPHLFVHSLIVDTERAFDGDQDAQGYADYMVTVREFKEILKQLYQRDYVLVNPEYVANKGSGRMEYQKILLPQGKKPLVLSQDDTNYYEYMEGDGFAKNLTLDAQGKVVNTYLDAAGREHLGAYDMVPLVDEFVAEHPDFSYRGSKGIIALTGYNGVLGYRTSALMYPDSASREQDTQQARRVADAMKSNGWVFASHSWGHINYGQLSAGAVAADADKWDREVKPIVGGSQLLIYPFGADISDLRPYGGQKYRDLSSRGFSSFFNVDASVPAWQQLGQGYWRQARINVDGLRFAYAKSQGEQILQPFFDLDQVIDPARPSS